MVKKLSTLIVALVFVLAARTPLFAELKYTVHMEARPAANGGGDPIAQMMAGMLAQIFPPGGIDQVVIDGGEKGTRTEQKQAFATIKAGTVTLVRPDGSVVMFDPSTKTYWKQASMADAAAAALGGATPNIKLVKRGDFETINGMKAERLQYEIMLQIPGVDPAMAAQLGDMTMRLSVWQTDAIKTSATSTSLMGTLLKQFGMAGVKELADGRVMVKGIVTMFGTEIVTTTSGFTNEPAPAGSFDVPADYKEVPSPIK